MFENISATKFTPAIDIQDQGATIDIKGSSYPENIAVFYDPFIAFLKSNLKEQPKLKLNIDLVYFNSSTSKVLMNIFDLLEDAAQNGKSCQVTWWYDEDNELAQECGEEFQEDYSHLSFELKTKDA